MSDSKLGEALARRLEFERLFGIEEVYVSAERRADARSRRSRGTPASQVAPAETPNTP